MTSTNTGELYDLFNLNEEEKIFDEFNCFFIETFPIIGKLYLTENYILFYSNFCFMNKTISIPFEEITKLELNNINVEIESKNKENSNQKFKFFSNDDIHIIYDKIKTTLSKYSSELEAISRKTSASSDYSSYSSSKDNLLIEENEQIDVCEEIKFAPINNDIDYEICKKIIDISPKDLFEKYYTKKFSQTSYEKYLEWVGDHSNIKISEWEKIEDETNPEKKEKFKNTEKFSLALHGVPLVDHSEVSKTSTYYIENDGTYIIEGSSKSEGIPYADNFTIETKIELYPYHRGNKTVFRTYVRTNFLKTTYFFDNILISQTKKSYTEEINKWLEFIQEKGEKIIGDYIYKEKEIKTPLDKLSEGSDNTNDINNMDETEKLIDKNEEEKNKIICKENECKISNNLFNKKFGNKQIIVIGLFLLLINIYILFRKN